MTSVSPRLAESASIRSIMRSVRLPFTLVTRSNVRRPARYTGETARATADHRRENPGSMPMRPTCSGVSIYRALQASSPADTLNVFDVTITIDREANRFARVLRDVSLERRRMLCDTFPVDRHDAITRRELSIRGFPGSTTPTVGGENSRSP